MLGSLGDDIYSIFLGWYNVVLKLAVFVFVSSNFFSLVFVLIRGKVGFEPSYLSRRVHAPTIEPNAWGAFIIYFT